jgi:hypothetical protein
MKTLRVLRNISALFIFGVAVLAPKIARVGLCRHVHACRFSTQAHNCSIDSAGNCNEAACQPGQPCAYAKCKDTQFCL